MKKRAFMTAVLIVLLIASTWAGGQGERKDAFSIATAGTAGALYPMGVAMAEVLNANLEGVTVSAESSGASLENVRNLMQGNVEWGISQNEIAYHAYTGQGDYAGSQFKDIRSLFGTVVGWVQIFVPSDSPINSVADFKGERIGVGQAGSGGEAAAKRILAFYGLDYDSIKPEFISDSEMVSALKDGILDGFICTHPLKSAALLDLTTSFKVKMIPVADEGFFKDHPYYTKRTIPAGTYKGVDYEVTAPTTRVVMYTTKNMPEELVYQAIKTIWENTDGWINVHAAVTKYTQFEDACSSLSIPLHKGAAKYYREAGLEIPAKCKPVD